MDDRTVKEDQAISIVRERNWQRYGVDAVNVDYIRGLSDDQLDKIINPDTAWRRPG